MTFKSLPLSIREVKATEAVLERLYNSARLGLKGDALAYNAGLLPTEFRRLCQMDPIAEYAVAKGHADTEAKMAKVIQDAAESGDAKVALDYLKHRADWVAKQQVQVNTTQSISITLALEQAQQYAQAFIIDEAQERGNAAGLLTNQPSKAADGYTNSDTRAAERVARLRP
jgi:N-acetylglucosamine kinase-like BadF-type ATPase